MRFPDPKSERPSAHKACVQSTFGDLMHARDLLQSLVVAADLGKIVAWSALCDSELERRLPEWLELLVPRRSGFDRLKAG